jgi:serine/threonine protein phosphatase PrpC
LLLFQNVSKETGGEKVKLIACGKTDTGVTRNKNEDNYCYDEDLGLFVVADGIGGHTGGEIASKIAVEVIRDYIKTYRSGKKHSIVEQKNKFSKETNSIASGIQFANHVIYEKSQKNASLHGMGTTVAAVLLTGNKMSVAHVGDSRVYLVRAHSILPLTEDHSVVSEQVKHKTLSREDPGLSNLRNIITRALGFGKTVEIDLEELEVMDGDRIILCSDGLTTMVPDDSILSTITSVDNPDEACKILIDTACANGGKDNITVIVIYLLKNGWLSRLRTLFRI